MIKYKRYEFWLDGELKHFTNSPYLARIIHAHIKKNNNKLKATITYPCDTKKIEYIKKD